MVNAALSALLIARPAPTTHAPSSSSSSRHIKLQADSSSSSRCAGVLRSSWVRLQHALLRAAAALRLPFGAGSGSGHTAPAAAGAVQTVAAPDGLQLVQCPLLNISVCSVTVAVTAGRPEGHPSAARTATAAQPVLSLSPAGTMQQQQHGQKGQDGQQQQQPRHSLRQLKLSPSSSQQQRMAAVARHAKSNPVGQPNLSSSSSGSSVHTGQPVVSSVQSDSDPSGVLVVVYNPLAWTRQEVVRLPVSPAAPGVTYTIQGMTVSPAGSQCQSYGLLCHARDIVVLLATSPLLPPQRHTHTHTPGLAVAAVTSALLLSGNKSFWQQSHNRLMCAVHVFAAPCRCRRCRCAQSAAAREPVNSTAATRAAQVRCVQLPPACGNSSSRCRPQSSTQL